MNPLPSSMRVISQIVKVYQVGRAQSHMTGITFALSTQLQPVMVHFSQMASKSWTCIRKQSSVRWALALTVQIHSLNLILLVHHQPCGLMGRYLVIQSLNPCPNCKPLLPDEKSSSGKSSSKGITTTVSPSLSKVPLSFPIPLSSIQIFGYPVGGKGRD